MDFQIMIMLTAGTLSPDHEALTLGALVSHRFNVVATVDAPTVQGRSDPEQGPVTRRSLLDGGGR